MDGNQYDSKYGDLELGELTMGEIWQIPEMLSRNLKFIDEVRETAEKIVDQGMHDIFLTGDGTSFHAGFVSSYTFNQMAGIRTYTEVSPEFGYLHAHILDSDDVVIGISQSGESEMTVQAIRIANMKKAFTVGVVNNPDSTLAREAKLVLELRSGEEKSVLATKTYINTLAVLNHLAIHIAHLNKKITDDEFESALNELKAIPKAIEFSLGSIRKQVRAIAPYFKFAENCFVLGSGVDYGAALEASLKLKEGARIFSQAYSAAEFPHGPITLADEKSWILAMVPPESGQRQDIVLRLLKKVKKRRATVTVISSLEKAEDYFDMLIHVPKLSENFQPFLNIIPVQLLSVELAIQKGINPDKPKFLSKISSV